MQVEARTLLFSDTLDTQLAMHLLQDLGDLSLWEAMQVGGQDDPTSADFDTAAALSGLELDPPGGAQLPRSMSSDLDEVQGQSRFRDFRRDVAELKPTKPVRKSERFRGGYVTVLHLWECFVCCQLACVACQHHQAAGASYKACIVQTSYSLLHAAVLLVSCLCTSLAATGRRARAAHSSAACWHCLGLQCTACWP